MQSTITAEKTDIDTLVLPTIAEVENQLPQTVSKPNVSDEVKSMADSWIEKVTSIEGRDLDAQNQVTSQTKTMGSDVELTLVEQSKLLQAPMSELMNDADHGGDVAQELLKMEQTARSIDPNGYDFTSVSGIRVFLAKLGVPTPLQKWIARYQSTEAILNSITEGLEQGKAKLKRDNVTLKEDQIRYRKTLFKLDDYIAFAAYIDQQLDAKLANITDEEQSRFLRDEVLFPIRNRHQDLLTSKGIYQQAWVTSELIIKTNEELIRGVDRAIKHTLVALGIATSLAIALARQKRVLVALESSKQLTEKMILDVAEKLETQGTAILQQASEPFIQVEVMKLAFTKSLQAMDNLSSFRTNAIQSMKADIAELNKITADMDKNIVRIEQGHNAQEQFKVILD